MFVFKAAVVGAGTMGGEIAQVIAAAGIPVVLKDVDQKFVDVGLQKAREVTEGQVAKLVEKGKLNEADAGAQRDRVLSLIAGTTSYDGFGHVVSLDDGWPEVGSRLVWDSPPAGRGRVVERVTAYESRTGQTLEVEDGRLEGIQSVTFEPGPESVGVILTLDYRLKERNLLTPVVDLLFIRRALAESLRRTLRRFSSEVAAERQFGRAR